MSNGGDTFEDLGLDSRLIEHLQRDSQNGMGLSKPTNVQNLTIPILCSGKNVFIKSETGSGKTLAYLLPIINDLLKLDVNPERSDGTRVLVLAPTRELCIQIGDVINKLTKCCVWIVGGTVSGGEKKKSEKARLRKGLVILVGTPGRLLDHLRTTESFSLTNLRWIVLDEADRLLDMGFEQTVLEILSIVRGEKFMESTPSKNVTENSKAISNKLGDGGLENRWRVQVASMAKQCKNPRSLVYVMASATLSPAVQRLAVPVMGSAFQLVDADKIATNVKRRKQRDTTSNEEDSESDGSISDSKETTVTPSQLKQHYMTVPCKWRLSALVSFLRTHCDEKIVVFFSTCDSVDWHALLLKCSTWPTELDASDYGDTKDENGGNAADAYKLPSYHPNASHVLDPLPTSFTGMPGANTQIYRLHGSVPQRVRQSVYREFCDAQKGILLCTDVAARGLDLPRVDWILQYDPPCETADYVHRVGRTARRGLGGSALLFLLPSEKPYVALLAGLGLQPEATSVQSLYLTASKQIPGILKFNNVDEMTAVALQRRLERVVFRNRPLVDAARQAFRSFVRAYATHSADSKGIFRVHSLHLGHVAKSFALRESPKSIRNHEDVIGKIFNGEYTLEKLGERRGSWGRGWQGGGGGTGAKRGGNGRMQTGRPVERDKDRDRRFRDTDNGKGTGGPTAGNKRPRELTVKENAGKSPESAKRARSEPSVQSEQKTPRKQDSMRKLRKIGKGPSPKVSGSFRKSGGYFRKKLREQVTSEFNS